ncbi:MAG: AAA family ATPase [Magnetococcales bacterium]|nr:AAA family ATPase [Magnetococcales bacterium]
MITVVGNLKGGCGKSTITFNLAVWLARHGQDVVTFDLDPQATLSDAVEVRREEGVLPDIRVFRSESDPARIMAKHRGEALVDVGASNLWAMRQAIGQADRILCPVPPSQADVWSTARFLEIVKETATARSRRPEICLFVNRADTHPMLKESDEAEAALATLPGVTILKTRICQRTAYRRSFSEGRAVFELAPGGKASQEFLELVGVLYPELVSSDQHAESRSS